MRAALPPPSARPHRGRLASDRREERESEILDAAFLVLRSRGIEGLTMDAVASQARASKETLYKWFGDLDGLLKRLIERNADGAITPLLSALNEPEVSVAAARAALRDFAVSLLTFLTSEMSVVINRAAMASPRLGKELRESGPRRVAAAAAAYFDKMAEGGLISSGKREDLFALFFGLIVRDAQIQSLHGEPQRDLLDLTAQAIAGVDDFLALTLRESAADGPTPRTLVQVRSAIDAVDCDIIALLAKRQSLVKQAAEIKKNDWPKSLESSVRDPARVRQVLEARTVEALKVGVDPRLINAIWPPMIATFIELELQHATRETPRS